MKLWGKVSSRKQLLASYTFFKFVEWVNDYAFKILPVISTCISATQGAADKPYHVSFQTQNKKRFWSAHNWPKWDRSVSQKQYSEVIWALLLPIYPIIKWSKQTKLFFYINFAKAWIICYIVCLFEAFYVFLELLSISFTLNWNVKLIY